MIIFIWILVALGTLYAILDLALITGLRSLRTRSHRFATTPLQNPSVSVLVCARNEESHLPACLEALLAQDYQGLWTLWIADDRSTDRTPQLLAHFVASYPERVRYIRIESCPEGLSPKKHALTQLSQVADGEIWLLTDADCIVPPTWIRGMVKAFAPSVDWVSGYSFFPARGGHGRMLDGVQALDFLSHRTVDAAGIGLGIPITACGQNLGYRASLFSELNGFEGIDQVVSGDDDLLMHKLAAKRTRAIHYCTDPATFVQSEGAHSWRHAWEQRKRWASKTVNYNVQTILLLGSVFAFYLLIFGGLLFSLLWWTITGSSLPLCVFALAWIWKTLWDGLVMAEGMHLFHCLRLWPWFVPTCILHIPQIVGAVLAGTLGKFSWKDGNTSRNSNR